MISASALFKVFLATLAISATADPKDRTYISGYGTTTSTDITTQHVVGQLTFTITDTFTLKKNGQSSGGMNVQVIFPVNGVCDIHDPNCVTATQITDMKVDCLSFSGNTAWFSGLISHYQPDPRLTAAENAQNAAQFKRRSLVQSGRLTDNGPSNPDSRSFFITLAVNMVEGLDNSVAPIGGYVNGSNSTVGLDGSTLCQIGDAEFGGQADGYLVCTGNPTYCVQPAADAKSKSGLNQAQFDLYIANTGIQWVDGDGNDFGSPVANTVANVENPPAAILYSAAGVQRVFSSGNIIIASS